MTKKYYRVEFYHNECVWAEDKDEAYDKAIERIKDVPGLYNQLDNFDDCVEEEEYEDWGDPDAPEAEEES